MFNAKKFFYITFKFFNMAWAKTARATDKSASHDKNTEK